MGNYIDKNHVLTLAKEGKIVLEADDTITDEAILFAYQNNIDVYKLTHIKPKLVQRVVVTIVGKDTTGIIAGITTLCKEYNINILDINQTVLHGDIFTMAMVVDINESTKSLETLNQKLLEFGKEKNLKINVQHEDLFNFMHRI